LKKEAKTLARLAYALGQRERLINKIFLVLFLKKELLPCFIPAAALVAIGHGSASRQHGIIAFEWPPVNKARHADPITL
jgi:hypothetical protein